MDKPKFIRGYSRTFGDNIWDAGDYRITRSGSYYAGWGDYTLTFKGKRLEILKSFEQAKRAAIEHAFNNR